MRRKLRVADFEAWKSKPRSQRQYDERVTGEEYPYATLAKEQKDWAGVASAAVIARNHSATPA